MNDASKMTDESRMRLTSASLRGSTVKMPTLDTTKSVRNASVSVRN